MIKYWPLCLLVILLSACSESNERFTIHGSFRGFNQGELYVYGVDGTRKLDTVGVAKGEFQYNIPLEDTITLVIVFPNFSELPVFAEPGADIDLEGDANHLKEAEISGTEDNETMTTFRLQTSKMTPPEVTKAATEFIKENPASPISRYIFSRYFVRVPQINYKQAKEMAEIIKKANPDNKEFAKLSELFEGQINYKDGGKLAAFTATDLNGKKVSSADLNAKVNIITLWASWNQESMSIQNLLNRLSGKYGDDMKVLSVCLDADIKECRRILAKDSVKWSTVCDGQMWEAPILQKTGMSYLPDNILVDAKGKILAHNLNYSKMSDKLRELLE